MASGVFGLKKVYKKQVENVDQDTFIHCLKVLREHMQLDLARSPYAGSSKVYRIDLTNDLIDEMANSPNQNGGGVSGFSNRTHGYWGGGHLGNPSCYVRSIETRLCIRGSVSSWNLLT